MKRILSVIVLIFIIISFNTVSMAADVSVTLKSNKNKVEPGTEVRVTVSVNNFTREGTQKAIEAKLEYDTQKLQYKSINWGSGWTGSISSDGTGLVVSKSSQVSANENIAEIVYVVKDNTEKGNAVVGIKNIVTSVDGDEVAAADARTTIEITEKATIQSPNPETPAPESPKPQEPVQNPEKDTSNNKGQSTSSKTVVKEIKSGNTKSETIYPYTGWYSIIGLLVFAVILVIVSYIKLSKYKEV